MKKKIGKKFEHPHPFHSCISFTCCFCLFEVSSCLLFHNNAGSFTYKFLPNILFVSSLFPAKNHKLVFFHSKPHHIWKEFGMGSLNHLSYFYLNKNLFFTFEYLNMVLPMAIILKIQIIPKSTAKCIWLVESIVMTNQTFNKIFKTIAYTNFLLPWFFP